MVWRILSLIGGLGGLVSLALPYALVSGGVLGLDLREKPYTLFELAGLLERAGNDPQMVYLLAFLILVGSTMVLVGSVAGSSIAFAGGLVQAGAAAAFAYGVTTKGSKTFLHGLGQVDASLETGVFVLAVAGVASMAAAPLELISDRLKKPD